MEVVEIDLTMLSERDLGELQKWTEWIAEMIVIKIRKMDYSSIKALSAMLGIICQELVDRRNLSNKN